MMKHFKNQHIWKSYVHFSGITFFMNISKTNTMVRNNISNKISNNIYMNISKINVISMNISV